MGCFAWLLTWLRVTPRCRLGGGSGRSRRRCCRTRVSHAQIRVAGEQEFHDVAASVTGGVDQRVLDHVLRVEDRPVGSDALAATDLVCRMACVAGEGGLDPWQIAQGGGEDEVVHPGAAPGERLGGCGVPPRDGRPQRQAVVVEAVGVCATAAQCGDQGQPAPRLGPDDWTRRADTAALKATEGDVPAGLLKTFAYSGFSQVSPGSTPPPGRPQVPPPLRHRRRTRPRDPNDHVLVAQEPDRAKEEAQPALRARARRRLPDDAGP